MNTFEVHPWSWAIGIGLPLSAAFVLWQWRKAQRSIWRRWVMCLVLVLPITPLSIAWSNGHSAGGVVTVPAAVLAILVCWKQPLAAAGAAINICIASLLLFGLWSLVRFACAVIANRAWRRARPTHLSCVRCGAPLGASIQTCGECGWTQPYENTISTKSLKPSP